MENSVQQKTSQDIDYRLGFASLLFMLPVAFVLDLLSFLPVIDIVLDFVAAPVFWVWYALLGVPIGFTNPRLVLIGFLTILGESNEVFVDWGPWFILGVIVVFILVRIEDRTGVNVLEPVLAATPNVKLPGGKTVSKTGHVLQTGTKLSERVDSNRRTRVPLQDIIPTPQRT